MIATVSKPLIQEPELMDWTGYKRRDALVNWLREHKVDYWLGNRGIICVTADAINSALLRTNRQPSSVDEIEF